MRATESLRDMQLFFDVDGTLTDSSDGIMQCLTHALAALGQEVPSGDGLRRWVGPPLATAFAFLLDTSDAALIERAIAAYRARFETTGMFENVLYPGVRTGLENLSAAGHRLRVVTVKPEVYARQILRHFEIDHFFEAVHGPGLADRAFSKALLVKTALECAGASHRETVMVGDRAEDVYAAREHGVRSVAAAWGYGSIEELRGADPDYVAYTVGDLLEWLRTAG